MLEDTSFKQWAILELMGHVRLAGLITEEELFGSKIGRIDIHRADGSVVTQYFGASSIYRLTPTTEDIARAVATNGTPAPVSRRELRLLEPRPEIEEEPEGDDYPDDSELEEYSNLSGFNPTDIPF